MVRIPKCLGCGQSQGRRALKSFMTSKFPVPSKGLFYTSIMVLPSEHLKCHMSSILKLNSLDNLIKYKQGEHPKNSEN